jgi:hypothetical protein
LRELGKNPVYPNLEAAGKRRGAEHPSLQQSNLTSDIQSEMTIEGIGDEGSADCVWFSDLVVQRKSFPLEALEAVVK